MNSLEFAYWLQGFFELSKKFNLQSLDETQVQMIKQHLDLVFENVTHKSIGFSGTCGTSENLNK